MRRSNSSTHIPIPKSDSRNRSKSLTRGRSGSLDKVPIPTFKRSISSSSVKKPLPCPSSATGAYKRSTSSTLTPTLGGYRARGSATYATPSSARSIRSRSKSPNYPGSERAVNNPSWVAQQFKKVREFLETHPNCPEHIPGILKPPTINTFAFVMNLLLKEINPRIEINTTNYKEIVLNTLKMLHYPGNVSNSMFKTVNAMHTWPHVISIFGWLVDLVTTIRRVDQPVAAAFAEDVKYRKFECTINYLAQRYFLFNSGLSESEADETFEKEFAAVLNIDQEHDKQLAENVAYLCKKNEEEMKSFTQKQTENDAMIEEINRLQRENEICHLDEQEMEENLDCELKLVTTRRDKLVQEIERKKRNIAKLKETVNNQSYTIADKKKVDNHIKELEHTIQLKKEKLKVQKAMKEDYDLKLLEARKKIESEIYRLNSSLIQLTALEPELKIIQFTETDFLSKEFEKNIKAVTKSIEIFKIKYSEEFKTKESTLSKLKTDSLFVEEQIGSVKEYIQTLVEREKSHIRKIEEISTEMETVSKKRQIEKDDFLQKMEGLKKPESALVESRRRYNEIYSLMKEKEEAFELLKEQMLDFFHNIHDNMMDNIGGLINIRNDIIGAIANCLSEIAAVQDKIAEDLADLKECQEHGTANH